MLPPQKKQNFQIHFPPSAKCVCKQIAKIVIYKMTEVPSSFNDIEESTTLRILCNFSLLDSSGKPVALDELGEGKRPARLTGTIIEPLSQVHKDKLVEMLSSAPLVNVQNIKVPEMSAANLPTIDWCGLEIGSEVDGYCTKTMKWYEGKVMDLAKISGDVASFKVHFKGWNSKHDEWIDRGSPRLLPYGTMTHKVATSEPVIREYVPWYENTAIYDKASLKCALTLTLCVMMIMFLVGESG
jgi:hypothetical protein